MIVKYVESYDGCPEADEDARKSYMCLMTDSHHQKTQKTKSKSLDASPENFSTYVSAPAGMQFILWATDEILLYRRRDAKEITLKKFPLYRISNLMRLCLPAHPVSDRRKKWQRRYH